MVRVQADHALVHLVADKEEHIDQRDLIGGELPHQLLVVVVFHGIGGINHLCGLVIQACQLRKLPGRQLIRQLVAVQGINVGQAHGVVDLVVGFQLLQKSGLRVIVPGRDHQRHHIGGAEIVLNHVLGNLGFVELRRRQSAVTVSIGALIGEVEGKDNNHQEHNGNHMPGRIVDLAYNGDLGHKILVFCLVDQGSEQDQQARHNDEHRQQRKENGLDQINAHVGADLELHEHHGCQAADGSQGAGADFRNSLAEGYDSRLPDGKGLVLHLEPVAQNYGVVQGQRQLQDTRHGVGYKGNGAEHEVAALVQDHGHHKGDQQHRHLTVGLGGQQQYANNDERHQNHNNLNFRLNGFLQGVAQLRGDVQIPVA